MRDMEGPTGPDLDDSDEDIGMPRWVRILGLIALLFVAAVIFRHLRPGGFGHHGMP